MAQAPSRGRRTWSPRRGEGPVVRHWTRHGSSRGVDLRRRLLHRVVAVRGCYGLGLPHLTHATPHSLVTRVADPTRTRLTSAIALSLGGFCLLAGSTLTIPLTTTLPPLSLLVIRGSLGRHPLRNPLRIPRKLIQLKRSITITHRVATNHRLTHPVRLLMQYPIRSLHPQMRPQPRTPMRIRLSPTEITHIETESTRMTYERTLIVNCYPT